MTRGLRISDDLRKVLVYMRRYITVKEIAKLTNCKTRTIQLVLAEHRRRNASGSRARLDLRGRRKRMLSMADVQFLHCLIRQKPDLYLDELQELLEDRRGVKAHASTIWRALRRSGYSLKRITKDAVERDEQKRAAFRYYYGLHFSPEQTVFVDESSFDRRTAPRRKGWAVMGHRVHKKCFFVRGKRYSLLPALGSTGMIYAKVVEGSFTANRFYDFINALLSQMNPFPYPNSVIVMDNARIHKDP